MAHAAGCLLGTGTDLVVPWMPPGISLWREAEIFAEAGLSPMDVLKQPPGTASIPLARPTNWARSTGQARRFRGAR